jgi:hypothetical protein
MQPLEDHHRYWKRRQAGLYLKGKQKTQNYIFVALLQICGGGQGFKPQTGQLLS